MPNGFAGRCGAGRATRARCTILRRLTTCLACTGFLTTAGARFDGVRVSMVTGGPPSVAILVSATLVLSSAGSLACSGAAAVIVWFGAAGAISAIAATFVSAAGKGVST